jgi:serine/threonine protein kinase
MEFMDGGNLTDILEQFEELKMTEPQIAFVTREVLPPLCLLVAAKAHISNSFLFLPDVESSGLHPQSPPNPQRYQE